MKKVFCALGAVSFIGCSAGGIASEELFDLSRQPDDFETSSLPLTGPPAFAMNFGGNKYLFTDGENEVSIALAENPNPGTPTQQILEISFLDASEGSLVQIARITGQGGWFKSDADFREAYKVGTHSLGDFSKNGNFEFSLHRDPTGVMDDIDWFSSDLTVENVRNGSTVEITDTENTGPFSAKVKGNLTAIVGGLADGPEGGPTLELEEVGFVGTFSGSNCMDWVQGAGGGPNIHPCDRGPLAPGAGPNGTQMGPGKVGESIGGVPNPIVPWITRRGFESWSSSTPARTMGSGESGHGGLTRVFMNPTLEASMAAGNTNHPVGSAAVLESGNERPGVTFEPSPGYEILVKVSDTGDEFDWWWAQAGANSHNNIVQLGTLDGRDGTRGGFCGNCHRMGGIDNIRSAFPLQ